MNQKEILAAQMKEEVLASPGYAGYLLPNDTGAELIN
jgi:hypothetical protein